MVSTPENRVAIVAGAAQGIGKVIALKLATDGLDIVICDLDTKVEKLKTVESEIEKLGRKAKGIVCDVSNEESIINLVRETVEMFGRLDVVSFSRSSSHYTSAY
jgi:NAD(P)-dependent dehydrogenase (short-subunit alcohol dehydrogenase family)